MARIVLSVAAAADIEAIAEFLDDVAPHATDAVLGALETSIRRLATHPGLGHLREDLTAEPVRSYTVWSYLVVYRVTESVEIVRVLHASRDVVAELGSPP